MKVRTQLLIFDGETTDDCGITKLINEFLDDENITSENLIDIKFSTQERNVPDMNEQGDDFISSIDGYMYKVAILVIYKVED